MNLDGVFPPIPTTFQASTGEVDEAAIAANVRRWMATGLCGIVALGSNGEAALLDENESDRVVAAAKSAMPGGRPLIVGVGRESTRATQAAALAAHYTAVADDSPAPVLLYNLPGATGVTLTPALVATLASHPNIAGMKETSPDLERLGQFVARTPAAFRVLIGWAPVCYPALVAGATGAILAVANVVPDACVELHEHARAGRHAEALALQQRVTPLAQLVTSTYGVPGLKLALELVGYHGGPARAPLLPAPAAAREEIAAALAALRGHGAAVPLHT
jgi:4-hydroxy-2-oxoglutarate aldolase